MSEPWFDHVVSEIHKCDQNAPRLLEITTQIIYLEDIELIPDDTANRLMDQVYAVNNKPDPAGRWRLR